jgi:hypothetical protein
MNDKIDDFFEREREAVPLLAPPPHRYEELQTIARRRRNRNTTMVSAAAAVVLAVGGTGVVLATAGGGTAGGNAASRTLASAGPSTAGTIHPQAVGTPVPTGFVVSSMSFASGTHGWALGYDPCGSQRCAAVIETSDDTASWHLAKAFTAAETSDSGLADGAISVRFVTQTDGWIVGGSQVLATHDAGAHWSVASAVSGQGIRALEAPNSHVVYASSADGSTLWVNRDPSRDDWSAAAGLRLPAGGIDAITTSNITVAVVRSAGSWSTVRINDDRGSGNWATVKLPCTKSSSGPAPLYQLVDDSHATVVCGNGTTYWMDPYGKTVKPEGRVEPRGMSQVLVSSSISVSDGITVAAYLGGGLVASGDHGASWHQLLRGSFSYVGMTDAQQGFALAGTPSHQFWLTLDGGTTWTPKSFG